MKRLLLSASIAVLLLSLTTAMARDQGKDRHWHYDDRHLLVEITSGLISQALGY